MDIFLTGGAGLVGRAVATHLLERGYRVHLRDLLAETDVPHTTYQVCDIMNYETVAEQMRGCDAVIHLAALKNPMFGPAQEVFRVNTVGTFNIFEAAAQNGIKRIVQASSINAIGCAWNIGEFTPQYLPVDEKHISLTTDSYSLSKQHVEDIGAFYWRRDGISSLALRLPGVYTEARRKDGAWAERRGRMREFLDSFVTLPEAEQKRQLAEAQKHCLIYRGERNLEFPKSKWAIPDVKNLDERLLQAYIFDRYNLWASLDERDTAIAFEQSLTASLEGSYSIFVNDTQNFLGYESQVLAQLFFPDVPANLQGTESLVSTKRARELIGFEPRYSLHGEKHD